MSIVCAVDQCQNEGKHIFPKDEMRRTQWIQAIKCVKPGSVINKYSRLCRDHFNPTDYYTTTCLNRVLKRDAIPSIFNDTSKIDATTKVLQNPISLHVSEKVELQFDSSNVKQTYSRNIPVAFVEMPIVVTAQEDNNFSDPLQIQNPEIHSESPIPPMVLNDDVEEANLLLHQEEIYHSSEIEISMKVENETQTEILKSPDCGVTTHTQTECSSSFSIYNYKDNDKSLHFYTGLECFSKFMLVFHSLGKSAYCLKYFYGPPPLKTDTLEQFFITLIILRRHKTFVEICMLYKITLKQVYTIFITWIRFMSLQWKNVNTWVERDVVTAHMPFDFYEKYPATRVIIDATECPIKKPTLPLAQQVTFSTYKNKNTIKFLVGITPGGLISYISPVYGGSASDRQIIERSHILNKFNYKDEIMVDKGLNVQDIFIPYGVKVNMPAFFKKGNQIEPETLTKTRKVASKRVHVERVIGMMKTYKILTEPMNQTEIMLSRDIVVIIGMLVNFRLNIINKDL